MDPEIHYAVIVLVPVRHRMVVTSTVVIGMIITMKNHVFLTHNGEHGVSGISARLRQARENKNEFEAASHWAVHPSQTVQLEPENKNANVVASGPRGQTIGTPVNVDNI